MFKSYVVVVLLAGAYGQTKPVPKPPVVTTCTPTPGRGPSLMLVDSKGSCAAGYKGMKNKGGEKVLYCVNSKPYEPPVECKTAAYAPQKGPAPPKKK